MARPSPPPCLLVAALVAALTGCSLVIDDPAPFPEPPSEDAGVEDEGPIVPDFGREDAFAPRAATPAAPADRRG